MTHTTVAGIGGRGQPPSFTEPLETIAARTPEPEPDLEAEP
jgi:hypothetical protein